MAANGWVIASAPDESSPVDTYWDGDEFATEPDDAFFFAEPAGNTINSMRQEEGSFQQRFDDRDIRLLNATQTITINPPTTTPPA
ncbi:MAG: hypothetical protein ACFB4J_02595 [Elainellaceae cyanobacterium]